MAYQFVKVEREGPLTLITLDRANILNALHPPAHYELAEVFDAFATTHFAEVLRNRGRGLRFLSDDAPSPAMRMLREHLARVAPEAIWHTYEPLQRDSIRDGAILAFGEPLVASYRLERADVILALDADFLGDDPEAVSHAREFGKRRSGDNMNRLYVVENTFTITGSMADHRLSIPAADVHSE